MTKKEERKQHEKSDYFIRNKYSEKCGKLFNVSKWSR